MAMQAVETIEAKHRHRMGVIGPLGRIADDDSGHGVDLHLALSDSGPCEMLTKGHLACIWLSINPNIPVVRDHQGECRNANVIPSGWEKRNPNQSGLGS